MNTVRHRIEYEMRVDLPKSKGTRRLNNTYVKKPLVSHTTCKRSYFKYIRNRIPALTLLETFKRALVFWKAVKDKKPVSIDVKELPPEEEIAFLTEWKENMDKVFGQTNGRMGRTYGNYAHSLIYLSIVDEPTDEIPRFQNLELENIGVKTPHDNINLSSLNVHHHDLASIYPIIKQYETEFNNPEIGLSTYDCKKRPIKLSFVNLVDYIANMDIDLYNTTKLILDIDKDTYKVDYATLAESANELKNITIIICAENSPCSNIINISKDDTADYKDTLFIKVEHNISSHQDIYVLPKSALLKSENIRFFLENNKIVDIHPKLAYFLWKDPKLRRDFLVPCFGVEFLPSVENLKRLPGYSFSGADEDKFARIYYQLCYDTAHWILNSGKSIGGSSRNTPHPAAGVFPSVSIPQSPVSRVTRPQSHVLRATRPQSPAITKSIRLTPAFFYKRPNIVKYESIINFLYDNNTYNVLNIIIPPHTKTFGKLFTRKHIINKWRNRVDKNSRASQLLIDLIQHIEPELQILKKKITDGKYPKNAKNPSPPMHGGRRPDSRVTRKRHTRK